MVEFRDKEFNEFKEIIEHLEIEKVEKKFPKKEKVGILKKQNVEAVVEEAMAVEKGVHKWKAAARRTRKVKKSWTLIDGSVEVIGYSSTDDCWIWIRRFLTIGNIGVIAVCLCFLIGSSYLCFKR